MGLAPRAAALVSSKPRSKRRERDRTSITETTREQLWQLPTGSPRFCRNLSRSTRNANRREPIIVRSILAGAWCAQLQLDKLTAPASHRVGTTWQNRRRIADHGLGLELCEQIGKRFARYKSMASFRPIPSARRLAQLERAAERLAAERRFERGGTVAIDKSEPRRNAAKWARDQRDPRQVGEVVACETLER